MSELIDRQALLDAIEKDVYASDSVKSFVRCVAKGLPTIDAMPVRHGEWKERYDTKYHYECPFCRYLHQYKDNYCPNCGARMDGERREG